jgi:aspartyl-tRNA synthetase
MLTRNLLKLKLISNKHLHINPILNSSTKSLASSNELTNKPKRTHYCGSLGIDNIGQKVTICGWLQTARLDKFFILRDLHGNVQVLLDHDDKSKIKTLGIDDLSKVNKESVILVQGTVIKRPDNQINPKMSTGQVEIKCEQIELLNNCKPNLPFELTDLNKPNETVRLQHRYLDLRFKEMQQNLLFRSKFVHKVRQFMNENNFIDIETPTLFRRTPGGAREFIVPTNKPEHFYSLTQSPQQFKQLLMIAGMDKYYQVARCYRDETSRPDRQPEFTQIDIEMSFVDEKDIMNMIEALLKHTWPHGDIKFPLMRMKFADALDFYGCDKPDLRFGMEFSNLKTFLNENPKTGMSKLDNILANGKYAAYSFKIPAKYAAENLIDLNRIENEYKTLFKETHFHAGASSSKDSFLFLTFNEKKGNHITKYMSSEFRNALNKKLDLSKDEICVVLVAEHRLKLLEIFGKLRLSLARIIDENNVKKNGKSASLLMDPNVYSFLWVVDFPLFTLNEETNKFESTHHPFTAPVKEQEVLVKEMRDLESVLGLHYDLVLNGCEIAGGSIRIHNASFQRHVLENILKEDTKQLEHLISALEYGAPPHGGIAFGLDRLIAILCGTSNIRNVMAFPKSNSGKDLMGSAPATVTQEELDYYKIKCVRETNA